MSYVTMNRLPDFTQDIFRFINGQPVRVPTINNIGINRFAAIGRTDEMVNCNPDRVPTRTDPRLMTINEMMEYQRHPDPIGPNAMRFGL